METRQTAIKESYNMRNLSYVQMYIYKKCILEIRTHMYIHVYAHMCCCHIR